MNPLAPVQVTDDSQSDNPFVAQSPTLADGWAANASAYGDWVARQRASGVAAGMIDPQTGWPTQNALIDAAHQFGGALIGGTAAPGSALKLPARAASEDVNEVMQASFPYGRTLGAKTVPIDKLNGGVALNDPAQAARISALKDQMTGPGGYISRPIVDTNGNVIEGQHRLEALRQLGVKNVPVHMIQDLSDGIDVEGLHDAIKSAQPMHSDHRHQLTQMILEGVADEGSPQALVDAYEPPRGFESGWNAGLNYLAKSK